MIIKAENLNEMLYTIINESKVGKTILFQGDSWIQQITDSRKNSSYLKIQRQAFQEEAVI